MGRLSAEERKKVENRACSLCKWSLACLSRESFETWGIYECKSCHAVYVYVYAWGESNGVSYVGEPAHTRVPSGCRLRLLHGLPGLGMCKKCAKAGVLANMKQRKELKRRRRGQFK